MTRGRNDGRPARRSGGSKVREGFARLQKGLTGERALIGESYMDDAEMLGAYLDYYWPVSRAQALRALSVAAASCSLAGGFRRVIDVGSGPGPVAAAFIDRGAEAVTLVDQSSRALDLALRELPKRCASGSRSPAPVPETVVADISSPDPDRIPLWGKADCVSFGHSLNELWPAQSDRIRRRADLLERYAEALADEGFVLVIEPALLATSRDLLAVRDLLVERGWLVIAPCCGRAALGCPALDAGENQTCHDEIEWSPPPAVAALARSMGLDKDSLKMTWFMFAPPRTARALTEKDVSDRGTFRVVSDAMLNKGGRERRLICGSTGRFPLSVAQGHADSARSGFNRLRRGDEIAVRNPERRENGWGVGGETKIEKMESGKIK